MSEQVVSNERTNSKKPLKTLRKVGNLPYSVSVSISWRRTRLTSFAAGALLLLSACGGGATAAEEATAPATAPAAADAVGDAPVAAASPLVDQFTTVSGETIDLANFQGQDVVLWYWAPW